MSAVPEAVESPRVFTPPGSPLSPRQQRAPRRRCQSCSESDVHRVYNTLLEEHGQTLDKHSRHVRSTSCLGRIKSFQHTGTIVYFCRSRGHGFIRPDSCRGQAIEEEKEGEKETYDNGVQNSDQDIFLHISDIDNEFVPRAGDRVSYQLLPMPPKFEKHQAVHVRVIDMTNAPHKFWSTPQSKEEIEKEKKIVHETGSTTPAAEV